eukprot:jgi/Mesen1/1245/ME000129S00339
MKDSFHLSSNEQVLKDLMHNCEAEFADICAESQACEALNRLEALCEQQGVVENAEGLLVATRPPVASEPPAALARTQIAAAKLKERQELLRLLQQVEEEKQEVSKALEERTAEAAAMASMLTAVGSQVRENSEATKWASRAVSYTRRGQAPHVGPAL